MREGLESFIHLPVPRPLLVLSRLLFIKQLRAATGAGNRRTRATNGAALERPLVKAFAAMPGKWIEGNINLKNTNANPDTKTLTHQGHSTSRLSNDSSFRPINLLYLITHA